jgi:hypothetical protein
MAEPSETDPTAVVLYRITATGPDSVRAMDILDGLQKVGFRSYAASSPLSLRVTPELIAQAPELEQYGLWPSGRPTASDPKRARRG